MSESTLPRFRSPRHQERFYAIYDRAMQTWPVPFDDLSVMTSFGKTHVVVAGPAEAPPLLLLHGFMATAAMWGSHVDVLSRHYRVYAPDVITDTGKSVSTRNVKNPADYVAWLKEVLDGLQVEKARVMGLSYGGWLTSLLAIHAPERVERAVILCPAGTLDALSPQFFLRALPGMLTKWTPLLRWYWKWFMHRKEQMADHPSTALFVAAWQTFIMSKEFVVPSVLTDEELRCITVPATVLVGDHEVIYKAGPAAALQRAKDLIPGGRAYMVSGAGHVMTLDNPEAVTLFVLEGLA